MRERVFVVEDDPDMLEVCAEVLRSAGYEVVMSGGGAEAEAILRGTPFDLAVVDLKLPAVGGLDLLRIAKEADPDIAVVLMTGFPSVETAVEAMKFGATEYLVKSFTPDQLLDVARVSLEKGKAREAHGLLKSRLRRSFNPNGIVGQAPGMLRLFEDVRRAASVAATVIILGESGTGKELVARAIHDSGRRRGRPFLALNCAAIPESLVEAELFGYERGAFTGADRAKEGLLELADAGTVFLDEVCELGPAAQAKLLRALEEGAVRRLAGRRPVRFDVRFMAATNRDLREEVARQRFREDLFFRLDVIEIRVPPLRERPEDIPLLAAHFLETSSTDGGKLVEGLTQEALDLLTRYDWPGNVRELRNAVERSVAYASGPFVTPDDLPPAVVTGAERQPRAGFHEWKAMTLERLEREFLEKTLGEHAGNVTRAAEALEIHRSTLQRLMRRLKLPAA